jgi:uncharacterized protein (TIGR02231 family)
MKGAPLPAGFTMWARLQPFRNIGFGGTMKKVMYCMLLVYFGWVIPGYASQFLSSNITEVTLFSDQALVERSCQADVRPGLNELLVELSAFAVDKDSVTAQVFGQGEIISVQIRDVHLTEFPQVQVQRLEEKLRELRRSRYILDDKKAVLSKKETFLDSLIDFSKTQLPKDVQTHFPETGKLKETIAYVGDALEKIYQEKQNLDNAIEVVNQDIDQVKKELAAVRGGVQKVKQAVEILFNAGQTEKIQLAIQYMVRNASWKPLYKVSVPANLSDLNLTMFSHISQKTGEDWENVKLSLSNVIPLKGVRLPELSSWMLDIPRPGPAVMRKSMSMQSESGALMESEQADTMALTAPEAAAGYAQTVQTELPLSFEYQMPYEVAIASRDISSFLPVFTKKLQGDFFYYAVPQKTGLTFLVSELSADRELLSGQLNVYFSGRYIGETYLSEKKPGEPFYLNLGADRAVTLKREKIKDKIKETYFGTLQRDTIVREFAYKLTAENGKNQALLLKLEDSIPVSKTDKIQVKDLKLTPDPDIRDYKDKEGVMLWSFKLAPGEKKEILIDFVVTYPADLPPFGL